MLQIRALYKSLTPPLLPFYLGTFFENNYRHIPGGGGSDPGGHLSTWKDPRTEAGVNPDFLNHSLCGLREVTVLFEPRLSYL